MDSTQMQAPCEVINLRYPTLREEHPASKTYTDEVHLCVGLQPYTQQFEMEKTRSTNVHQNYPPGKVQNLGQTTYNHLFP